MRPPPSYNSHDIEQYIETITVTYIVLLRLLRDACAGEPRAVLGVSGGSIDAGRAVVTVHVLPLSLGGPVHMAMFWLHLLLLEAGLSKHRGNVSGAGILSEACRVISV